jgi:hypothetical protein
MRYASEQSNVRSGNQALQIIKKTTWPESVSELHRPSDHCLSAKLVPTFADRGVSRS